MFSNMSIALRIQLSFILVILFGLGVLVPIQLINLEEANKNNELHALEKLQQAALDSITSQENEALHLASAIASQPRIQRLFAQGNRQALAEELEPVFLRLKAETGIEQMQLHLPPAISFLRLHQVSNFGDDLSSFRHTVVATNQTKQAVSGIENGVAGVGIRGVVPMTYQGEHYGSLEFGLSLRQNFADTFKASQEADIEIYQNTNQGLRKLVSTLSGDGSYTSQELAQALHTPQQKRSKLGNIHYATQATPLLDYRGEPLGVMVIYQDRTPGIASYNQARQTNLIISAVIFLAGLVISWLVARGISRPIQRLNEAFAEISTGDQDLRKRITVEGKNELGQLASSFNTFVSNVEQTVLGVLGHLGELASKAEYTFRVTGEASDTMKRQQASTEEVSTAMNEMSATAQEIASHAAETASATEQADTSSNQGNEIVQLTSDGISRLAIEVGGAAEVIRKLSEYSENIGSILDVISGISEQTNLLALNAAIEAARAGEHGRGFAVVADEVRQLAQRSQDATGQIHSVIEQLQKGVVESVNVIERSLNEANATVEQTDQARHALDEITQAMSRISEMSVQIASAAEEQTAVSDDINRNLIAINDGAAEAVDITSNIVSATSGIGSEIAALMRQMRTFKVDIEPSIELDLAKSAHRAWKVRVRSFLDGHSTLTEAEALSHKQCDLGVWYFGEGMKNFGDLPAMQQLAQPHEEIHKVIKQIIQAKEAGNLREAEDLYRLVDDYSEQIVALLNEITAKLN